MKFGKLSLSSAECKLKLFNSFISTLNKRMDEITNYFEGRHSSGFVEGLNNKIKVIKRRCYVTVQRPPRCEAKSLKGRREEAGRDCPCGAQQ
jgi:hypothetical protein